MENTKKVEAKKETPKAQAAEQHPTKREKKTALIVWFEKQDFEKLTELAGKTQCTLNQQIDEVLKMGLQYIRNANK